MRTVSAYVPDEVAKEIESLAVWMNHSRSWVARELLKFALDNRITFLNTHAIDIPAPGAQGDGGGVAPE